MVESAISEGPSTFNKIVASGFFFFFYFFHGSGTSLLRKTKLGVLFGIQNGRYHWEHSLFLLFFLIDVLLFMLDTRSVICF